MSRALPFSVQLKTQVDAPAVDGHIRPFVRGKRPGPKNINQVPGAVRPVQINRIDGVNV